jgi:hypothetical protein
MRTLRQRLAAVVAMALLGATGLAVAAWSPASVGLVTAASADDGSDDDGSGGDDDDGGQVPAGGVDTGQGGAADALTGERVSSERSVGDVAGLVVPAVALGLGGLVVGRLVLARLRGSQG